MLHADVDACGPRNGRLKKRLLHHIYELDVALGSGMRHGEMYSITWDQVNFGRQEIVLTKTKNGSERIVYLNDDVVAALRGLQGIPMKRRTEPDSPLNENQGVHVFAQTDTRGWFNRALKLAKITTKFRWHDQRHTFCSRLGQQGANIKEIQVFAGHKSISVSEKYIHLNKQRVVDAVALLTKEHAQA